VAHQQEHGASEPKQDQKAENVKAPEPEPGVLISCLGEKCRRDRDQETTDQAEASLKYCFS
jgi:hypothetical protein